MLRETLSPRERVRCSLRHEVPDRIPIHAKMEKEVWPRLQAHFAVSDNEAVMSRLGIDIRTLALDYIGPSPRVFPDGSFVDHWGCHRKVHEHPYGIYFEYAGHPLSEARSVSELDDFVWPSADWWDVSRVPDQIALFNREAEHCILYEAGGIFELAWGLRGLDRLLMDMVEQPEIAQAIFARLTDTFIELGNRVLGAADGRVDIAWTWDDVGTQNGLMMSPRMWTQQLKPHHVRFNKALKKHDVTIMYHSDGGVFDLIDGFIDMGIEVLNPLQPRAVGMDPARIKARYGHQLSFHGGIDIQHTLPFGSPADVIAEVEACIRVLGAGGGYILAPTHLIQADTSVQNILALFETARSTPVPAAAHEQQLVRQP